MSQLKKALEIIKLRNRAGENDSQELQDKSRSFMDKLSAWHPYCGELKSFEMYSDDLKSKEEIYNYCNPNHNTRLKIPQESSAECDDPKISEDVMCYLILNLIEEKIHFAVFYAQGQRSVHVRIYDFDELIDLTPFEREKVQQEFWRQIAGLYYHKLDRGVWSDDHPLQMEHRPHWKYGTPFMLLFEYLPKKGKIKFVETPVRKFETINAYTIVPPKKKEQIFCPTHKSKYQIPTTYKAVEGILCWACIDEGKLPKEAIIKCKD